MVGTEFGCAGGIGGYHPRPFGCEVGSQFRHCYVFPYHAGRAEFPWSGWKFLWPVVGNVFASVSSKLDLHHRMAHRILAIAGQTYTSIGDGRIPQ